MVPIRYIKGLSSYGTGEGRANPLEFSYFHLALCALVFCGGMVAVVLETAVATLVGHILLLAISVYHIFPTRIVAFRRLRDAGRSGWWLLTPMAPDSR